MNRQPILEDNLVTLRPLSDDDFDDLYKVASDKELWVQHPSYDRYKKEVFRNLFEESMASGGALVIIDRSTGKVIGSSRYQPIPGVNNGIEIGWTFLSRKYWGGKYNGAIKRLMIDHAFKEVDFVLLHIGKENIRSIKAAEKIGAVRLTDPSLKHLMKRPEENYTYRIRKEEWGDQFKKFEWFR